MKRFGGLPPSLVAWLGAVAALGASCLGDELEDELGGSAVENEILVQLADDEASLPAEALRALEERYGIETLEPVSHGWVRVTYRSDAAPDEVARAFGRLASVRAAQPNIIYTSDATPNDPRFRDQYAHRLTGAESAWDVTRGDRSVIVAVVGDGVELSHPDLRNNLWRNAGESVDGRDNDGNGFVDDVHGYDFLDNDGDPNTSVQHETSVAGVVGAEGDNSIGVAGVAWRVSLMALRIEKVSSGMARAIDYAVANGADVINLSMSSPTGFRDAMVTEALARAEAANVVIVASAGNLNNDTPRYPAAFPNVLGVGATDANDRRAAYSCYGSWVDVAAPGDGVMTTYPGGSFNTAGGTSFAAPYVAGIAALLRARDPSLSAAAIRDRIRTSGDDIGTDRPIGRRVNAARALGLTPTQGCGDASCASLSATFSDVRGNNWWIQGVVRSSKRIVSVDASVDGGAWRRLAATSWGGWATSFYIPDGSHVRLRATAEDGTSALSGRYLWPSAQLVGEGTPPPPEATPPPPPSTGGELAVGIERMRGNNWWLEVWLTAPETLARVSVSVDGKPWVALSKTAWGPWVGGVHMPNGSHLRILAVGASGAEGTTAPYLWPDAVPVGGATTPPGTSTPPDPGAPGGEFAATFSSFRGNNWWFEVTVSSDRAIAAVHLRVNGGAWVALRKMSWGPWVEGVHIPSGSVVDLRARDVNGAEAYAAPLVWSP